VNRRNPRRKRGLGQTKEGNKMNNQITVEDLRRLLYNIEDQEITVRELRQRLFNVFDQKEVLTEDSIAIITKYKNN